MSEAPGKKFDTGKLRMDLLSPTSIEGLARVLTYGANKYEDRNWEKGISWSRVYGAVLRHLVLSFWKGEDIDAESGLRHIDHAACGVHFLQHYATHKREFDDRPIQEETDHGQTIGAGSCGGTFIGPYCTCEGRPSERASSHMALPSGGSGAP